MDKLNFVADLFADSEEEKRKAAEKKKKKDESLNINPESSAKFAASMKKATGG